MIVSLSIILFFACSNPMPVMCGCFNSSVYITGRVRCIPCYQNFVLPMLNYPTNYCLLTAVYHRQSKERWIYFVRKGHQHGYQNHFYKIKVPISIRMKFMQHGWLKIYAFITAAGSPSREDHDLFVD